MKQHGVPRLGYWPEKKTGASVMGRPLLRPQVQEDPPCTSCPEEKTCTNVNCAVFLKYAREVEGTQ